MNQETITPPAPPPNKERSQKVTALEGILVGLAIFSIVVGVDKIATYYKNHDGRDPKIISSAVLTNEQGIVYREYVIDRIDPGESVTIPMEIELPERTVPEKPANEDGASRL